MVPGSLSALAVTLATTGTPGSNPVPPAVPANAVLLAQVFVPAGASSITTANITDEREFVVAPGGVLPILSEAAAPPLPASQAPARPGRSRSCRS